MDIRICGLFDLSKTIAKPYLEKVTYPWEALKYISGWIMEIGEGLDPKIYERRGEDIWVAKSAQVMESAYIGGPSIIGEDARIRHGAFIRGSAIVGCGATVGNSTELKNVILFDGVEVPHYNYVGDSILGYKSHMGAGSITSNIKSDRSDIVIKNGTDEMSTGLRKIGAILADHVEVGCNSVLNPGSIIGKNTTIYPLSMVRGVVDGDSIFKEKGNIVKKS